MKTLITLTLLLSAQLGVAQSTWYVSNSGSNSNSGLLITSPFEEINHALSVAGCGDSIYVVSGEYHEKIQAWSICPENNRIVLQGDLSQKPLVVGDTAFTGKYAISALGEGYYFRNFKLTSPYPLQCTQSNQVIVGNGDHFTFDDVHVFNSGYDGIKTYGECATNNFAVNWKVINSEIYNCGLGCPTSVVNGDGIDFTECRNCLIENSVIRDNKGHQIQIKLEAKNVTVRNSHIEGIYLFQIGLPGNVAQCDPTNYNADSVFIIGNTIVAKGDTSEFIFKLADVHHLMLHNNTIVKDSIGSINVGFICFGGCNGSASWTNTPSAPVEIKSNIFANFSAVEFTFGVDTAFFDPFNIVSTEVTLDHNLFYDPQGQITVPIDNGTNSFVANPLFCDYPTSFEIEANSPCIDAGDPSLALDPDNSINDIGARYYQSPCTNAINEEEFIVKSLIISPNPSQGVFMLQAEADGVLTIVNLYGQEVYQEEIEKGQVIVDLMHIENGMYLFSLKDEFGMRWICRGIKN